MAIVRTDLSLTRGDLLCIAAREMGEETIDSDTGRLLPPTEADSLGRCRRALDRAMRRVLSSGPPDGWEFTRQVMTLSLTATAGAGNVEGDAARVRMPWFFNGCCRNDWAFEGDATPLMPIETVSREQFNARRRDDPTRLGDPTIAIFRPIGGKPTVTGLGWEAVFWPTPSTDRTLTVTADAYLLNMQEDDDGFLVGGAHHTRLIEAAVQLEGAKEIRSEVIDDRQAEWAEALALALQRSAASRPRSAGKLGNTIANPLRGANIPYHRAVSASYNGTPIT